MMNTINIVRKMLAIQALFFVSLASLLQGVGFDSQPTSQENRRNSNLSANGHL